MTAPGQIGGRRDLLFRLRPGLAYVLVLGFLGLPASPGTAAPSAPAADLSPDILHGLWRLAYEPEPESRADVVEPSTGYLVLLPDGTYYEMRQDCCLGPHLMESPLPYEVKGHRVILSARREDGTAYERELEFAGAISVSFYEDGRFTAAVEAPVLRVRPDSNYGWARVYPRMP